MNNKLSAVTLIELLISFVVVSLLVLGIYGIDVFSRGQLITSNRRIKLQNELSYALEYMSKYVQQGSGNMANPAIRYFPAGNPDGFEVKVDFAQTPEDLNDDNWVRFRLQGNALKVSCPGGSCPVANEDLTKRIIRGFKKDAVLSEPMSAGPEGFYAFITENGTAIEIGLIGRDIPGSAASVDNPQIGMKTRIICSNASSN